jgi:hypothetical protein
LGNVSQGSNDERWVSVFKGGFQIDGDIFDRFEMVGGIPRGLFEYYSSILSNY